MKTESITFDNKRSFVTITRMHGDESIGILGCCGAMSMWNEEIIQILSGFAIYPQNVFMDSVSESCRK